MNRSAEFEKMALELIALNLAFDSARAGEFSEEILRLSEEAGEKASPSSEPDSSRSL